MMRISGRLAVFVMLFPMLLLSLAWAQAHGFISARAVMLWSKAIMQVDGPASFNSTDAFFPPLPFVLSIALQWITGGTEVPIPFLLSAGLGAWLLVMWYDNLRTNGGISVLTCCLALVLLALNPFFLRVLAEGPEAVLTLIGTWIFARGIVNLRLSGNAPDMMKVAVGLLIVSLSNSYGLLIGLGALPFMVIAARPSMLVASPIGYLFAMFYPVVAAILSMAFISSVFDSALVPLLTEEPVPISLQSHLVILAGLVPVTLVAALRSLFTPHYVMPLVAAFGATFGAYLLNSVWHVESDPTLALAPMLAVLVVAIRFWPALALREPIVVALLALGVALGVVSLRANPVSETRNWVAAMQGDIIGDHAATRDLAAFLEDKDGIMVDVERNPEIVPQIDDIHRLLVSGQTIYDWALEGGRLQARYVLVPNMQGGMIEEDRILRRFPELKNGRLAFYEEVFMNDRWRVFRRIES
ncbi:hypothetical protein [Celeribacter halophilus]|uniref:hypothetical protein n=1 Tax=Celeribacter halophilus TaxID=576117 RepID=UPI003A90F66B